MATKFFCDRCRQEKAPHELIKIKIGNEFAGYDLCTGCLPEVRKFINDFVAHA